MHSILSLIAVLAPGFGTAESLLSSSRAGWSCSFFCLGQDEKNQDAIEHKRAAINFLNALQNPTGGFEGGPKDRKASLRSTSASVRALKYLTGKKVVEAVPNVKECAAFVMSCYDPRTGGFADTPGGKPDVALTAIGVMAAVDLEVPKAKFAKAMDYLKDNARTFEDVRIGAAAVEAWGVKDCPFKLDDWHAIAINGINPKLPPINSGGARIIGSITAFTIRLGLQKGADSKPMAIAQLLDRGQLADGGWCKEGEKASDMETTYRVMRAFHLLKEKPRDAAKVREFIGKCRNKDGGYGVKPGDASTPGGVYFAAIIANWLDEFDKK
jgi:prenyltransferase beta subunit